MGPVCLRSMPAGRGAPAGIERVPFTGSVGQVAEDIDAYAEAGMTHILFSPPVSDVEELLGEMRVIANEVRPLAT